VGGNKTNCTHVYPAKIAYLIYLYFRTTNNSLYNLTYPYSTGVRLMAGIYRPLAAILERR